MVTIKKVAEEAGVSVATVSRVINQNGYVSEGTLKKVKSVIKELNYTPNSIARSLYHKTSNMIGLIIPDITNPFFPELARAVEDIAMKCGYKVVLCNSDKDPEKEMNYLDLFKERYVDGIILTTQSQESKVYSDLNVPIVALDRIGDASFPSVVSNNYHGAKKATELLMAKGVKNIAHIRGPKNIAPSDARYHGFIDAVEEQRVNYTIGEAEFQLEDAERQAEQFFDIHTGIDGIFCSNDTIAAGFLKVALKRGIKVPEELQIIGFDGSFFGEFIYPELTTVSQPIYDMGAVATRLLIKIIQGEKPEKYLYEMPATIIERGTTR
ncbi:LacI family DNA-binding transcriptional regulator [Sporosarcina pasteurii]|uniref:Degradation activator n=1 Tax=Sporosarcina pasteurii TaxID=1474 RepID=A0A380BD43_SPOPA|nr:LacI family DNA-binding transcriptional regulator [Sporosarcina pasteurii]MDS9472609.1 LacI family DNA-binding transcriptional regulator [Sporosarcina pasteurii]QBQ06157.1 LacI family transcriptional regulator [Sporosarcina pasteurii]SUI99309.1 Degradation activator [Sporosarcina pasteurii]